MVVVVTLMDNSTDSLMADQGPARRADPGRSPRRAATLMTDGHVPDALIAEHGFSVLVTVTKAGRDYRFLFDAGTSPDGVTENMRRLDIDPSSIEAIVCSHGHFDHTTGHRRPDPGGGPHEHAGAAAPALLAAAPYRRCPAGSLGNSPPPAAAP